MNGSWRNFALATGTSAVLALGGACYAQLNGQVSGQSAKNDDQEKRLVRIETALEIELRQMKAMLQDLKQTLERVESRDRVRF